MGGYDDPESEILTRLTAEKLLEILTPLEREILELWVVEERSFEDIGTIVADKYPDAIKGRTGSNVRYHRDKIRKKLQPLFGE